MRERFSRAFLVFLIPRESSTLKNMAAERALNSVTTSLQSIEENLERFISYDKKHSATILSVLRDIFNHNKKDEAVCGRKIEGCPFESLQLDDQTDIDNEIIWQQIQLQNESLLPKVQTGFKSLLKKANSVQLNDIKPAISEKNEDNFNEVRNNPDFVEGSTHSSSSESSEVEKFVEENDDELPKAIRSRLKPDGTGKPRGSVVDDQFFKLAEMEKFLESKEGGDDMSADESDENIDYFTDLNEGLGGMSDVERYNGFVKFQSSRLVLESRQLRGQ